MGSGNFGTHGNNVTMYVMRLYNEAKYLEPPLPFRSFVRHVSKHLPREIQITLITRNITEITELEKILDIFQNIRDSGIWVGVRIRRCHIPMEVIINRGGLRPHIEVWGKKTVTIETRGGNVQCHFENYAVRTICYRCSKAKGCERNNTASNQHSQQQIGEYSSRGAPRHPEEVETTRGRGGYSQGSSTAQQENEQGQWMSCLLYTSRCV